LAALRRWMWWIHLVPAAAPPIPALPLRVSLDPQQRLRVRASKKKGEATRERSRRAAATAWCCVTRRGGRWRNEHGGEGMEMGMESK
jgi:hypothetical protein